jgi:hypothetical protein
MDQPDGLSNIVRSTMSDQAHTTEYSLCVDMDLPDSLSNIVLLMMSDQADTTEYSLSVGIYIHSR